MVQFFFGIIVVVRGLIDSFFVCLVGEEIENSLLSPDERDAEKRGEEGGVKVVVEFLSPLVWLMNRRKG